jgi:hypothetical protein
MKLIRPVALVSASVFAMLSALALLVLTEAARAEDPVFPPGIRIGIVPLVGLVPAKKFTGFESQDESVKVLMAELPADAYGEVMNALKTNPAVAGGARPEGIETAAGMAYYTVETARNGGSVVHRYSMILSGGTFSGYVAVQVPENASKIYSDDAVRRMFATATVRKEVPTQELLELMPFRVGDLGDFKTVRALATGGAILLADHGGWSDGLLAGAARGSRALCGAGGSFNPRSAQLADHDVRAAPYRRHGRIRNANRCDQRQGQYTGHRRAMVAVRRPERVADHRQRSARPMAECFSAFPRRPRWNSSALMS